MKLVNHENLRRIFSQLFLEKFRYVNIVCLNIRRRVSLNLEENGRKMLWRIFIFLEHLDMDVNKYMEMDQCLLKYPQFIVPYVWRLSLASFFRTVPLNPCWQFLGAWKPRFREIFLEKTTNLGCSVTESTILP